MTETDGEAAEIARAEQLEAAGRHREALETLARAANRGGLNALARVGAKLIAGAGAPAMPDRGLGLIQESADRGGAEGAAICAALCATGAFRPRNWPLALDYLQAAAEGGHAVSQGALAALAGVYPETPGDGWARLRAGIDSAKFETAPEGRDLHADPLVRAFEGFASPAICAWLIDRSRARLSRARVYDSVSQTEVANETRTNSTARFSLLESDPAQLAVQSRMAAAAGVPGSHMEASAVLHYAEGEQITEHFDFVDPQAPDHDAQVARDGQRIVTFLLYLNDDYQGGETEFPRIGVSHKAKAGDALFFVNALPDGKADVRTVHAGRPPAGGEKWIVSQFIRNRAVLPGAERAEIPHPVPR